MELENKIRKITKYKLRDFVVKMAGGATPKTTEYDKHYCTDDRGGIPFIRVQNLSPEGLQLEDCKYIKKETHNGILARSKVFEDNLLVKITGVGRMAISSIAPKGFEGNINQHMVVIKTKNLITSELIAKFLNSDIGEKLASRRSTGGTRPALDYTALRSIPIILNEQVIKIMDNAYAIKQQKEKEANDILGGINDYLINELGIVMPKVEKNTIERRISYVSSSDVIGGRFDPKYYTGQEEFINAINKSRYKIIKFGKIMNNLTNGVEIRNYSDDGFRYLRVTDMSNSGIVNNSPRYVEVDKIPTKILLSNNDLLISRSGSLGLVNIVESEIKNSILSSHIFRVSISENVCVEYLQEFLRTEIGQFQFFKNNNGGIIPEINQMALRSILIVLPTIEKQKEIAKHIKTIRVRAKQLAEEAIIEFNNAKSQVEKILLGEE